MTTKNEPISISTAEVNPKNEADKKCAPGIKFEGGSCIKLALLIEMAKVYNDGAGDGSIKLYPNMETLNPKKYKKYLVYEMNKRMGDKCTSQKCWTEQSFVREMKKIAKTELEKYTFRPDGPDGRFEWLNTLHIKETMDQYEKVHPEFKFLGAVPMDFDDIIPAIKNLNYNQLHDEGKTKVGIVFNLDNHDEPGSHWVASYADLNKGEIFYYDSYATAPTKRVRTYMRRLANISQKEFGVKNIRVDYNRVRHQYGNSECGVFSMNFIENMLTGEPFDEFCKSKPTDKQVNLQRNKYFYNVDIKEK